MLTYLSVWRVSVPPPLNSCSRDLWVKLITNVLLDTPRCACKHFLEGPCSKQFTTTQIAEQVFYCDYHYLLLPLVHFNLIDFGIIMLSLQILIWTAKASHQNVLF